MNNQNNQLLDLYSDYLISSFGQTTATRLATLLGGSVSHDKITRFLASQPRTSADLWKVVKPYVRQIQSEDSENSEDEAQEDALIVDDSIAEKSLTPMRTTSSAGIMTTPLTARSRGSTS